MLGDTAGGRDSGDAVAAGTREPTAVAVAVAGVGGSNSGDDERGERSSLGGNRWPRQETLALLRIRSDMDVAFRDASVKGPLWEDVSRKLAELGYQRSAKKCKEKFENVYKYHKRTKDGRSGKPDGKTYRFFDQLEALDHKNIQFPNPSLSSKPPQLVTMPPVANTTVTVPLPHVTVPSTIPMPIIMPQSINLTTPSTNLLPSSTSIPTELLSNDSLSSASSDATLEEGRRKRKRKWKDLLERLMREVMEKQEELQKRLLNAVEKREQERIAREESWRMQEMQRINKEREILAQERSIAAAKDAAVMQFLQKIAEQQNLGQPFPTNTINITAQPQPQQQQLQPQLTAPTPPMPQQKATNLEISNAENFMGASASSSRWPKVEVQALIKLRTSLEEKYQENEPKGPLWEEISAGMRKFGYDRSAKRCKEKWENINKYFKKVKESNKKRPEDSKTCPYFHQLDALYREKNNNINKKLLPGPSSSGGVAPLMVQPEQQWPPQQDTHMEEEDLEEEDELDKDNNGHGDGDGDEEEEEDKGGGNHEIVATKPPPNSSPE